MVVELAVVVGWGWESGVSVCVCVCVVEMCGVWVSECRAQDKTEGSQQGRGPHHILLGTTTTKGAKCGGVLCVCAWPCVRVFVGCGVGAHKDKK